MCRFVCCFIADVAFAFNAFIFRSLQNNAKMSITSYYGEYPKISHGFKSFDNDFYSVVSDENGFYNSCFNGDFENASNLIKNGVSLNKRFDYGRTLLHIGNLNFFD
jgi:hypothetical protein